MESNPTATNKTVLSRAWYGQTVPDFLAETDDSILGKLVRNSEFAVESTQTDAWIMTVAVLRNALSVLATCDPEINPAMSTGRVYLEFVIPRMGKRIDIVLVIGGIVFAVEFKAGDSRFNQSAVDQVWDYALDLKNFHETSHHVVIAPILIATGEKPTKTINAQIDKDLVYRPIKVSSEQLAAVLKLILGREKRALIDPDSWILGSYRPTPTIIEAARALYAKHSVDAIARHDAGAKNLTVTSDRIETLIEAAQKHGKKMICFVTGVPGAGKTLVGLNVATQRRAEDKPTHAVFLSGNGPLVEVLREALARDEFNRAKKHIPGVRKGRIRENVKSFIQNVHHFRDEGLRETKPPADHVIIFDEAQRAWNLQQTVNFMQRKKKRSGFEMSEPQFLISYIDRHDDWAFILCLVGGGQEISQGEAGIGAWITAVTEHFPQWEMVISDKLVDSEYAAAEIITKSQSKMSIGKIKIRHDECLHLSTSMRSFRAESLSGFVKQMLDLEMTFAQSLLAQLQQKYPIVITRNLDAAKTWIKKHARGSERFGMVASSKAMRLKPHAVDVRIRINPVHWFLNATEDVRSSFYLEDAATEFEVQGLELDWVCVTWDGDFRKTEHGWSYHDFKGSKWQKVHNSDRQRYTLNAYRVLLTRARQGMVIFVPPGQKNDETRLPQFYDATYRYLESLGMESLSEP